MGRNLSSNCHNRRRIHISCSNTSYKVGCPWSGSCQTHTYTTGSSCITVCCVSCALFVSYQYMFNVCIIQHVIKWYGLSARITKYSFDPHIFEGFYYCFSASHCKNLFIYYTIRYEYKNIYNY